MAQRSLFRRSLFGCLGFLLTIVLAHGPPRWSVSQAQGLSSQGGYTVVVEVIAQQVYDQFPTLPKANQYRRQSDGLVATDNTLISRLIRYHRDIKKRPTRYRFDWRLTLADYLGANDIIRAERYPGFSTLQESPLEGDRQLIEALNRQQRQELVDFLAEIYRPRATANATENNGTEGPEAPKPPAVAKPNQPGLSQPGDAQLLMP